MYHIQSYIKFDFFTVDLNEEYSAVFGGVLLQQTEFVSQCINTIIKTYEKDYKPTSIILIGHSMVIYYNQLNLKAQNMIRNLTQFKSDYFHIYCYFRVVL